MKIVITEHARERITQRGTTKEEIIKTLAKGREAQAKGERKSREMVFNYNKKWLGIFYPQKKVVVVYTEEAEDIVVITVKVYYGKWR